MRVRIRIRIRSSIAATAVHSVCNVSHDNCAIPHKNIAASIARYEKYRCLASKDVGASLLQHYRCTWVWHCVLSLSLSLSVSFCLSFFFCHVGSGRVEITNHERHLAPERCRCTSVVTCNARCVSHTLSGFKKALLQNP